MIRGARRLAVLLSTLLCISAASVFSFEGGAPSSGDGLPAASEGAPPAAGGPQAPEAEALTPAESEEQKGLLVQEEQQTGSTSAAAAAEEEDEEEEGDEGEASSAAGPQVRRLKGKGKGKSRGSRGGLGNLLVFLGTLMTGIAAWRKTSELYHSPRQAMRKAKMHLLGQVPSSWDDYVRSLPVLNEDEFPELRPLLRRLDRKPVVLMSVPHPRPHLSSFLKLTNEQREEGIVIKAKSTAGCTFKEVAFELFAHEKLAKGLPLSLPSLGAFRDAEANTLYLITPRARADVALYTRRMPELVNLQLAFAEMVYGLWGMHRQGWVHRDIKGCNYFVSQDGHALLADFEGFWRDGMHAIMYGEEVEIIFTQHYVSPELTFDGEYQVFDRKSDVFALGRSFQEMLAWMGDLPVPRRKEAEDLIAHMLEADPKQRYDLKQCMAHPYFAGIDFDRLDQFPYGKAFEGNYITPYKFL